MRYTYYIFLIFFLPFLFAGCDSSSDSYPNLGDIAERPPMPSVQEIHKQRIDLLKTRQQLQKEIMGTPL